MRLGIEEKQTSGVLANVSQKSWFAACAYFHTVNIPTVTNFRQPPWGQGIQRWEEGCITGSQKPVQASYNMALDAQRRWTVPCFTKTLYRLPRSWHHSLYPTSHRGFVQLLSFQAKPSEIPVSKSKLPWSLMKTFTFINKITEMLIFLTLPTTLCDVYGMLSCTKS